MPHLPQTTKSNISKLAPAILLYLLACNSIAFAQAQEPAITGPLIARVEMQLAIKDKIVDTIRKGDMLNFVEQRGDAYVITTMKGVRGAVDKVNALRLAEAAEVYSDLIDAEPKVGQFYTMRASAWWARGENEKALADYDKAIGLGYAEPHAFSSRGLFHSAIGNSGPALADFTTAIEKGKSSGKIDASDYVNRAAVYVQIKKYDRAILDYSSALRMQPKNAGLYQQRAVSHKLAGEFDKAIADFSTCLRLSPDNVPAFMGRGFLHFQLKNHSQAVKDFSSVITINPNAAQAYNNRGFNYKELGQLEEALADYEKAIELSPNFALAHQNRGWLLATAEDAKLRNGEQAVASARKACTLNDYSQLSDLMTLAAAFAEIGNFKEAIGWQEKVIKMAAAGQRQFAETVAEGYKQEKTYLKIVGEMEDEGKLDAA